MSDFKAKMYQIQFWLGLCPRLSWGSLQHSPDPLAALRGPTSKGRGGDKAPPLHAPLSHISGYAPELPTVPIQLLPQCNGLLVFCESENFAVSSDVLKSYFTNFKN